MWLLARLVELWPQLFPTINVIDLDAHFGYDLMVVRTHHLTGAEEPAFVELKLTLRDSKDFNSSFDYLTAIVCWETNLRPEEELVDIQEHRRTFKAVAPDDEHGFTRYFLNNPSGGMNIEVIVLRKYLEEILSLHAIS